MYDDELWRLWEMLPTHVGDSIGIGNLAELMELSVDRTLRLLNDLVPHGARCTKGERVGNVLRYNYWWREPEHN